MQLTYLKIDDQLERLHRAASSARPESISVLSDLFDASWIFHDLSIEGSIFRDNELERALSGLDGDNWLENQLFEKVRNMKRAIHFVREEARVGRSFDLELVKEIHRQLQPSDDESAGRYRKDSGSSSAYRHDIVSPKTISYRLRRLVATVDKTASEDPFAHPIRLASQIHRELVEIFPFSCDNGIVARLAMNFWIMRHGYPPAVIHMHDRHRYFDSYLSENGAFRKLVVDSMLQAMEARIRSLSGLHPVAVAAVC